MVRSVLRHKVPKGYIVLQTSCYKYMIRDVQLDAPTANLLQRLLEIVLLSFFVRQS
jgi:hypothetical protein